MMLNTENWKEFKLYDYFEIKPGKYYYPEEYDEGDTPYVSASNMENGVSQYIDRQPDFPGNCIVTGKVGCTAFYQPNPFCATSDVNVFIPKFKMHSLVGLFLATMINFNENYRWAYGRQCRVGNSKKITIKLPANEEKIPDWKFMEEFMGGLHHKPLTTSRISSPISLTTHGWKTFKLNQLFEIKRGNGFSKVDLIADDEGVNYVSRQSYDNGVNAKVQYIEGVKPFEEGLITVALGGEYLGSSFVQREPFYTGAHMAVMRPKYREMTLEVKLFITSLIRREAGYKYQAFGRELDTHINDEFTIDLPITDTGVPDWDWMELYIKSLPMAEHLPLNK